VDLHVRPIHHREPGRVRAHIFLCMLAYYAEWHLRKNLAPLLFDDEDKAAAEKLRASVVAPAQRSTSAQAKAHSKRTPDDYQCTVFKLSSAIWPPSPPTVYSRKMPAPRPSTSSPSPTALQQRALDLLQVSL